MSRHTTPLQLYASQLATFKDTLGSLPNDDSMNSHLCLYKDVQKLLEIKKYNKAIKLIDTHFSIHYSSNHNHINLDWLFTLKAIVFLRMKKYDYAHDILRHVRNPIHPKISLNLKKTIA